MVLFTYTPQSQNGGCVAWPLCQIADQQKKNISLAGGGDFTFLTHVYYPLL